MQRSSPASIHVEGSVANGAASFLAAWEKNDPFFLPAGAEAFRRDIPGAKIQFFDTGHFALKIHAKEIAAVIRDFFAPRCLTRPSGHRNPR